MCCHAANPGVYSQKLTAAMRDHDWEQARMAGAYLAAYVALEPTTHSTQLKISTVAIYPGSQAWICATGSNMVDRYSTFFSHAADRRRVSSRPHGSCF